LKARQNAVVVKSGAAIDGAELIRYCEGRLSYFAIPRFIDFVADLPRTESGKVPKIQTARARPLGTDLGPRSCRY